MACSWEIIRYKCQLKGSRWETIKEARTEEEAERWLRVSMKYSKIPARVIREEVMMLSEDD